ncbi:hypothetical protein ADUPG1_006981 [Aduncisulcus paluster]|uniref:Uncharacterized protein n=1 Tax=Aduncisulcus paluster TaxID=2918883 RepID=A0ABQ5KKA4_9EUKA|nr:hypothetical protein ADUPG1_006981 [Aduncisulcus paluster]
MNLLLKGRYNIIEKNKLMSELFNEALAKAVFIDLLGYSPDKLVLTEMEKNVASQLDSVEMMLIQRGWGDLIGPKVFKNPPRRGSLHASSYDPKSIRRFIFEFSERHAGTS